MSETDRDERGRFTGEVTEQDILKAFDRADAPFLTAAELGEELGISRQAANYRLKRMREEGHVERKQTGARSVGWWATVAPAPSPETLRDIEATEGELEHGETISQAEMKKRLGIDR
jgi:predicted transcriptional regulator